MINHSFPGTNSELFGGSVGHTTSLLCSFFTFASFLGYPKMVKKCIRYASNWKRYRSLVDKIVLYLHKYVWNIISALFEGLPL